MYAESYPPLKAAINELMENFDFSKVHKTMKATCWIWTSIGIPSIPQLKAEAERLLNEVASRVRQGEDYSAMSCGGFRATYLHDCLRLEFVVSSSRANMPIGYANSQKEN